VELSDKRGGDGGPGDILAEALALFSLVTLTAHTGVQG
jgi:hypothetical protein